MIHFTEIQNTELVDSAGNFSMQKLEAKVRSMENEGFTYLHCLTIGLQVVAVFRAPEEQAVASAPLATVAAAES